MNKLIYLFLFLTFFSCVKQLPPDQFITVLGNVQDAGYPHIGCEKFCCNENFNSATVNFVTSLGITDLVDNKSFLLEATPDISMQLKFLKNNIIKQLYWRDFYLVALAFLPNAKSYSTVMDERYEQIIDFMSGQKTKEILFVTKRSPLVVCIVALEKL